LVRLIGGKDAYDNTPEDREGRDAYNKGVHNANKRKSSSTAPASSGRLQTKILLSDCSNRSPTLLARCERSDDRGSGTYENPFCPV
jgi:hypothetical protein